MLHILLYLQTAPSRPVLADTSVQRSHFVLDSKAIEQEISTMVCKYGTTVILYAHTHMVSNINCVYICTYSCIHIHCSHVCVHILINQYYYYDCMKLSRAS